mmetsp:Transcript_27743/g.70741  ORF Transcript_27743/g.70741 Transcript_27743/m.70741 type:complete len:237 (-) Transcript_27743:9-719(-)
MGLGLPPRRRVGAEVGLGPGREDGLAVDIVAVGKRERERRRAADHLAGRVVLGAVARAHVLVLSAVPRHDAAKVGADGVDGVVLERAVLLGDQVVGIALEALDERALREGVGLGPDGRLHVVTERIFGREAATATASARRNEEVDEATSHPQHGDASAAEEDKVHDGAALHVRDEAVGGRHGDRRSGLGGRAHGLHRRDREGIRARDKSEGGEAAHHGGEIRIGAPSSSSKPDRTS